MEELKARKSFQDQFEDERREYKLMVQLVVEVLTLKR